MPPSPAMTTGKPLRVADFDFDLPPNLIAQRPLPRRDDSRMMVVERASGSIRHARFKDFPELMAPGGLVVLNDTRVIPARAWGMAGAAKIEFLFVKELAPGLMGNAVPAGPPGG